MNLSPQSWRGAPVPIGAMWTVEAEERRPCSRNENWDGHRMPMMCEGVDRPGEGAPLFKKLHADRCRALVREERCQICGEGLRGRVIGFNQGQKLMGRPLLKDGLPMHPDCAAAAYDACPGLRRQHIQGDLRIWRMYCGDWDRVPVLLGIMPVERGGDDAVNRLIARTPGRRLYTGPELVLINARKIGHEDLMVMVSARRGRDLAAPVQPSSAASTVG